LKEQKSLPLPFSGSTTTLKDDEDVDGYDGSRLGATAAMPTPHDEGNGI
jgi:hypothetical protein